MEDGICPNDDLPEHDNKWYELFVWEVHLPLPRRRPPHDGVRAVWGTGRG